MPTKAYAVVLRNDIPQGTLQILDLVPHSSGNNFRKNIGEVGQTQYLQSLLADASIPTLDDDATYVRFDGASTGLVAYLLERVQTDPNAGAGLGDNTITLTQAVKSASLIIARVMNGDDITSAEISTVLSDVVGVAADLDGTQVSNSESWGAVEDVVKILAGHVYTIADNSIVGLLTDGEFMTLAEKEAQSTAQGSFSAWTGRQLYQGGSLTESIANGNLSAMVSANFFLHNSKSGSKDFTYGVEQRDQSSYTYSESNILGTTILPVVAEIASSDVADPCVFTTSEAHNLTVGDRVFISHHDGTLVRKGTATGSFNVENTPLNTTFTLEDADGTIESTVALTGGLVVITDGTAKHSIDKITDTVGTNYSAVIGVHPALRLIDEDGTVLG